MVCNKCNKSIQRKNNNYNMLQYEVNRVFDNFLDVFDFPLSTAIQNPTILEPKIEISEKNGNIEVSAELPGIDEKDIDIEVSKDGYLVITGEKKSHTEENNGNTYFSERSYGMVKRTIQLPTEVDLDKVSATFKKGVLRSTTPKLSNTNDTKKLEIKAE